MWRRRFAIDPTVHVGDEAVSGLPLRGSDGLVTADLDGDGFVDIVSVHESDTDYDGVARGHVRIAFGSEDPNQWTLVTLAEGPEAGAACAGAWLTHFTQPIQAYLPIQAYFSVMPWA